MKKRLLFLTLVLSLMLALCITSFAMEGSGTENDPYLVKTAEDFVAIQSNLSAHYRLETNIAVSSNEGAIVEGPFTGVFDGNGNTIEVNIVGATSGTNTYDSLFGVVDGNGKIKNLTVTGEITGSDKVAGIVGKLAGTANIDNCVNYAEISGRKNIGGIVGLIYKSDYGKTATITNCVNYGSINGANPISSGLDMGGIVGCIWETDPSTIYVINCANAGNLNGDGSNVGGICGYVDKGTIVNSINTGVVTATGKNGTILGKTESNVTLNGYYSSVDGKIIDERKGTVVTSEGFVVESAGVAIYLGAGSGIRGEFHMSMGLLNMFKTVLSTMDIEYGVVVTTKSVAEELGGDLTSEEAQNGGKVVFAPAMKNGEILYSYNDAKKGEDYHSYRFALTGFPDNKQSYNMEFVILGYMKLTDEDGNTYMQYTNTVRSDNLASNVEGTSLNAVTILRVAEVTLADGDFKDNQEATSVLEHIVSLKSYDKLIDMDGIPSYGHANANFTSHISSDDTVVFEINNTFNIELASFLNELDADGFVKTFENEINGNCFYTYLKGEKLVHISYYPQSNEVNISTETLTAAHDNITQPSYENKNASSITQIKLADNVSIKEGMSYVIHLADNTFFIIDGGWCYDDYLEADKLYDILKELAGEGNDIVIAGWIFTHCHGDHIGTFNYFVEKYHDSVTIKELLYNFPSDDDIRASASNYMLNDTKQRYNYFREMIATHLTDTEIVKVHSGYKLYYANAEIEILQTFEDLYPGTVASYDFNSSSTVFTVKIDGQKLLFVGDIHDTGAALLNKNYGSALKSDFVQVAHHGINSSSTIKQIYINSGASYVLYPAANDWYRGNINHDANKYLENTASIKQIFVSGIETFKIMLPYDGSIYDGIKHPAPEAKTEADRPETTVKVPDAVFDLDLSTGKPTDTKGNTLTVVDGTVKKTTVTHNGQELNGYAYTTDGSDQYYMSVKLKDVATENDMKEFVMGSFTFEIFLKLDKMPGATVGLITSCNSGGVTLYLRKQAGGQINLQMGSTKPNSNSGGNYSAAADMNGSGPVITAGELLHIVGSYNSKTNKMNLYLNGLLLCSMDYGEGDYKFGSGDDTVIGIGYNPQYNENNIEAISKYADYELYEAKIYNTALTDEQVAQEYWNCIDNLLVTEAENE